MELHMPEKPYHNGLHEINISAADSVTKMTPHLPLDGSNELHTSVSLRHLVVTLVTTKHEAPNAKMECRDMSLYSVWSTTLSKHTWRRYITSAMSPYTLLNTNAHPHPHTITQHKRCKMIYYRQSRWLSWCAHSFSVHYVCCFCSCKLCLPAPIVYIMCMCISHAILCSGV